MNIFISGKDPERARAVATEFESDGHKITYDWYNNHVPDHGNQVQVDAYHSLVSMGRIMGALHADVVIAFSEHDAAIGAVAGWNCAAPLGMHRHAIIVSDEIPQLTYLRNIVHASSTMKARAMVYLYGPPDIGPGEL